MMIINGIKKFSMYCTYLRNYGSMLLLQQMYTLYNLIPGHNTLSQNTFYQNTFSKTPYTKTPSPKHLIPKHLSVHL